MREFQLKRISTALYSTSRQPGDQVVQLAGTRHGEGPRRLAVLSTGRWLSSSGALALLFESFGSTRRPFRLLQQLGAPLARDRPERTHRPCPAALGPGMSVAVAKAVKDLNAPSTSALEAERMQVDSAGEPADEDLYTRLKTLQRQLEFLDIQARGRKESAPEREGGGGGRRKRFIVRFVFAGGVHQGGAEEPEERAPASAGGGEAHPGAPRSPAWQPAGRPAR
jgi:hypothetical protein